MTQVESTEIVDITRLDPRLQELYLNQKHGEFDRNWQLRKETMRTRYRVGGGLAALAIVVGGVVAAVVTGNADIAKELIGYTVAIVGSFAGGYGIAKRGASEPKESESK